MENSSFIKKALHGIPVLITRLFILAGAQQQHALCLEVGQAVQQQATVLGPAGTVLRGHEFHFSSEAAPPEAAPFTFVRLRNQARYAAGQQWKNVLGSYLHLHFAGCPSAAQSFAARCADWRQGGSLWEK